jgi:uncharacterized OB-fold protein
MTDVTDEILQRTEKIKARGKSDARLAPDPVNVPMIRHWAEAIGDTNPRWTPGPDTEAPPAMAQVWTMYGLNPVRMPNDPLPETMQVLDDAGFTSVLGTNCDQTYARTLRPGEVPSITTFLADVTGPKKTGVGEGYFITTKSVWTVDDEEVATMTFRVLKFKPGTGRASVDKTKSSRPMMSKDTSFFWEGTAAGELRIQKCNACGELRHPPGPVCPKCHAMDRGYVVASGRGTVHSFLVHHAPIVPGKQLPLTLALVDLDEGVRMVGEVAGRPEEGTVQIGDAVEVWFDPIDDEVTLAKWRPAGTGDPEPAPEQTSDLPIWELPITPTLVVSTALATRDFQDVHHDRDRSIGHGSKDIFINILSTTGLVQRYITDWAGPQTQILSCALRLGAPAYPYDTLRFTGNIVSEEDGVTTIDVTAGVSIGTHANARLEIRK